MLREKEITTSTCVFRFAFVASSTLEGMENSPVVCDESGHTKFPFCSSS